MSSNDNCLSLMEVKNNQAVTTSLNISKSFGMAHRNLLRRIRDIIRQDLTATLFFDYAYYVNSEHKKQPMFYMNKDGFALVAIGLTGKKYLHKKIKYLFLFDNLNNEIKKQREASKLRIINNSLSKMSRGEKK